MSEYFELYSNKLYNDVANSQASASSTVIPSIFVMHLVNDAQFQNAIWVLAWPIIVILPLTKMWASLQSQRLHFNASVL